MQFVGLRVCLISGGRGERTCRHPPAETTERKKYPVQGLNLHLNFVCTKMTEWILFYFILFLFYFIFEYATWNTGQFALLFFTTRERSQEPESLSLFISVFLGFSSFDLVFYILSFPLKK